MIWIALAAVGIPIWMVVGALALLALRVRSLRRRPGNLAVRLRPEHGRRWRRGHAVWVHDVLAFSGTTRFWGDTLVPAVGLTLRRPEAGERRGLGRVRDPVVLCVLDDAHRVALVAGPEQRLEQLAGPFARDVSPLGPPDGSTPPGDRRQDRR